MSIALTTVQQRRAASLLRAAMDHSCEMLHFERRSYEAKSADAREHFIQTSFRHEGKHAEALQELAKLLNVDVETRKEQHANSD